MDSTIKEFSEKLHKQSFRQQVSGVFSIVSMMFMIVIFSLASVGWDYNQINSQTFITNIALLILIAVYGMPTGQYMMNNFLHNKINGSFQQSRNEYLGNKQKLVNERKTVYLREYCDFYFENKRHDIYIHLLLDAGIRQPDKILELDLEEVKRLKTEMIKRPWKDGTDTPLFTITEQQYDLILQIINGEIAIDRFSDSYYLGELSDSQIDNETKAKNTEKAKSNNMKLTWFQRMLMIIGFSFIMAGLFPNGGAPTWQTWINTASRFFMLITSLFWGSTVAIFNNRVDIFVYNYKSDFLELFYEAITNKIFVPKDIETEARKAFAEAESKKIETIEPLVKEVSDNKPIESEKSI